MTTAAGGGGSGDMGWLMSQKEGENYDQILLIFDLVADQAEEKNITVSPELVAHFNSVRDSVMQSINTTFRSVADYSQGTQKSDEPCCNVSHVVCRCAD